jgi:hypothetical protein
MTTKSLLFFLGLLALLLRPLPSHAEIALCLIPEAKGFLIEADDIDPEASAEITVYYDPAVLSNPKVDLETGTMSDLFDTIPGTVVFKVDHPGESAPSFRAHLSFDKEGNAPGGILSVQGKIMEVDGTFSPAAAVPNLLPTLDSTLASFDPDFGKQKPEVDETAAEVAALRGKIAYDGKSVLQRFGEYKGNRSLELFLLLFEKASPDTLVQEPPVMLSDGKTVMKVTIELPQKGVVPNFAMSDAKLTGVRREGEKGWVITALPEKGIWNSSLLVQTDGKVVEFPLVMAPPIGNRQGITRENFLAELDRFVSGRALGDKAESGPLGRNLYEYVFTANYLAEADNRQTDAMPEQIIIVNSSSKKE